MAAVGASSSNRQLKRKQQVVVSVSSSDYEEDVDEEGSESDEVSDEVSDEEYEGQEEGSEEDDEADDQEEGSLSGYGGEFEADRGEEEEENGDPPEGPSEEAFYNKVVNHLQRKRNLDTLKLEECKAYLRKHQLRLSGNKATCIERVLQHSRLKDGSGERLYPRSSFVINCTGDVCKGDVILFTQRVYEKFDIVTRGGNIIGKRIIAGRVVKESYGATKQQHTFTVEILWSKGVKPLPPLFPLLVKGRNLYKLKTFRQRWSNEAERSRILAEKHQRGAAARHVRAIGKARSANRDSKRPKTSSTTRRPPNKRRKKEPRPASKEMKQNISHTKTPSNGHARMKQPVKARHKKSSTIDAGRQPPSAAQQKHTSYHYNAIHVQPPFADANHDRYYAQMEFHQRNELAASQLNRGINHFPSYGAGYPAATAYGTPHHHVLNRGINIWHPYASSALQYDPRSSSHMFRQVHYDSGPRPQSGEQFHRWTGR